MSMQDPYQPLNCDDYDNLELACQHHLMLTLELKDGENLLGMACFFVSRKNVEYLVVEAAGAPASCVWITFPALATRKSVRWL